MDEILARLDDSDMELSGSENEDEEEEEEAFEPDVDLARGNLSDSNDLTSSDDENDTLPTTSAAASETKRKKSKKNEMKWYSLDKRAFDPGNITWNEDCRIADNHLETPAKYFLNYFTPEIFHTFAEQTNIYYFQKKGKSLGTNANEMRKFFGATILMANLRFPRIRMFWQRVTRVDRIANAMPVNRYFQLRTNVHINASQQPDPGNENKFWKVQPLIDTVRKRCRELPREEFCSVDEQMVPFTGRVPAKQFI